MMKKYKTWVFILVGVLMSFVGVNAVIWKLFAEDILTFKKYSDGDLARIGYIVGSKQYRKPEFTLPRKHIENAEYHGQRVDVLTIGDSFSNVKDNGRDPLYQDWIASVHNREVLNIQPLQGVDELATVVILLNSGYLDRVRPRFLIIETVERNCAGIYGGELDLRMARPLREIEDYFRTASYRVNPPEVGFLNAGNFKFIFNSLLRNFSDNAFFSSVYVRDLDASFFSVENDRRLLFYRDDIKSIPNATNQNIRSLNDNMNSVADLLRLKGITLCFMPVADKYNVYSDHIVANPYPKSIFFELLRKMPKRYVFVDTKAVLIEEIRKGEKDIYYADDTHWSWKAVKRIVESMKF